MKIQRVTDTTKRRILELVKTIAVVGLSSKKERPGYSVPAYMQQVGYRVIPVNPNLEHSLGEKAYPDLRSVPEPVDLVLIFRRREFVPPVIEQAIAIGAKAVWMQLGVINEEAAELARDAGLQVVMDSCIAVDHQHLFE